MNESGMRPTRVLLIGPYDPHCGEYTFLAPPLGVWRLAGVLEAAGAHVKVFDPNCCGLPPQRALEREMLHSPWDVIGVSTTGMTLRFDLELAYIARRLAPAALHRRRRHGGDLPAGADVRARPVRSRGARRRRASADGDRPPPAQRRAARRHCRDRHEGERRDGQAARSARSSREELRAAIFNIPYARMPYSAYWSRLEQAYRVGALPSKAAREARLAEIRSVRLITLNYCPMGCTFCSATNFLHEVAGPRRRGRAPGGR